MCGIIGAPIPELYQPSEAQRQAQLANGIARARKIEAREQELKKRHGDAYAGMDPNGNAILWRDTPVPATRRKGVVDV